MSIIFSPQNPQIQTKSPVTQTVEDFQPQKEKTAHHDSYITKRTAGIAIGAFAILGTAIAGYFGYQYLSGANMPRLDSSQTVVLPKQSYLPGQPFCPSLNLWDRVDFPNDRNLTTQFPSGTITVNDRLTTLNPWDKKSFLNDTARFSNETISVNDQPYCQLINPQDKVCFPEDRNRTFTTSSKVDHSALVPDLTALSGLSTMINNHTLSHVVDQTWNSVVPILGDTRERIQDIMDMKSDIEYIRPMQIGGFNGTQILSGVSQLAGAAGGYILTDAISSLRKFAIKDSAWHGMAITFFGAIAVSLTENNHDFIRLTQVSAIGTAFGTCQKLLSHSWEQLNSWKH